MGHFSIKRRSLTVKAFDLGLRILALKQRPIPIVTGPLPENLWWYIEINDDPALPQHRPIGRTQNCSTPRCEDN